MKKELSLLQNLAALMAFVAVMSVFPSTGLAAQSQRPHGLEPAEDMPYIADLGGVRHRAWRNQYGQVRNLSEAVYLRRSSINSGVASVPAGGLVYLSETQDEARPFMRDPFLLLGEHAYLVDLKSSVRTVRNFTIKKGEKALIDQDGNRIWFDYATDHYEKPYVQLALIAPSGGWPLEFPVSSEFPEMQGARKLDIKAEGHVPQIREFFLDKTYRYGMSRFTAKKATHEVCELESVVYPVVEEAVFSLNRPWALDLRQEDFRWYGSKRIYAFRRAEGFLVRVTDWTGKQVHAEKLIRPSSPQGYKDREDQKDDYHLTIPELDMRVEIMVHPEFLKHSDFMPTANDVPYAWQDGVLSFVVYDKLVTLKNGQPWPLDPRYKVGLEANLLTGKLQRLTLENAEPFTLDDASPQWIGPMKYSDVWNRPAFKVVAKDFEEKSVHTLYLRDSFFQRTDNMVFNRQKGRKDCDFFVGRTPTLMPMLESSFLTKLADSSYGTVVEGSHFTSYPKVIDNAAFYGPDHSAPFVPRLRGFERENTQNRKGDRITSAEGLVIRGSYVDYEKGRIVIPPAGLYYTSRNGRNIRTLNGESFFMLGRRAYIAQFRASTVVRNNFDLDFWRLQPGGDQNPIFWQDVFLGQNNKALRYTQHTYLDDRVMAALNIVKYSGNNFGAPFLVAQGFNGTSGDRYDLPSLFAEGATWVIPEHVGYNYARIGQFGTPSLEAASYTYVKPERVSLAPGQTGKIGTSVVEVLSIDASAGTVKLTWRSASGENPAEKVLGPLDEAARALLPQFQDTAHAMQFVHGTEMAELDIQTPFENGKVNLWLYAGLRDLVRDTPLAEDARFVLRPDVCGHCYQLNELLLDNAQAIILDKNNRVFEGPKRADGTPQFKIIIDDFDGEMIHAWHIETTVKNRLFKTDNLAFNPRNNIDVLVGVNGSIEGFLRASMQERLGYLDYWRRAQGLPLLRGMELVRAMKTQ